MNQDLDPFISMLTAKEQQRYRANFFIALGWMLATVVALFVLIGLMVNLQMLGFILGLLILGATAANTVRLIRRKTATEEHLLREAELRFGDSLFLQHGLIPGTKPPVLDRKSQYFTDENLKIHGIASISPSGAIEFARY